MPMKPGSPERYDYEYVRKGTANIFVAVEFKTGKRITRVTKRRTMKDFAMFVKEVLDRYPHARKLHIVLDNLNTHFAGSFEKTFGEEHAKSINPFCKGLSFIIRQSMPAGSMLLR